MHVIRGLRARLSSKLKWLITWPRWTNSIPPKCSTVSRERQSISVGISCPRFIISSNISSFSCRYLPNTFIITNRRTYYAYCMVLGCCTCCNILHQRAYPDSVALPSLRVAENTRPTAQTDTVPHYRACRRVIYTKKQYTRRREIKKRKRKKKKDMGVFTFDFLPAIHKGPILPLFPPLFFFFSLYILISCTCAPLLSLPFITNESLARIR